MTAVHSRPLRPQHERADRGYLFHRPQDRGWQVSGSGARLVALIAGLPTVTPADGGWGPVWLSHGMRGLDELFSDVKPIGQISGSW